MAFTVAILGRPNVGKSTLFNRLVGRREALVHPSPGVTRDRREGTAQLGRLEFRVIDTAGLDEAAPETMGAAMQAQTVRALAESDVALFLIDARAGVTPLDRHFADWLRRSGKPVVLLANKCEGRAGQAGAIEAFELGLGAAIEISAEHGEGMGELHDALADIAEAARPDAASPAEESEEGEGGPLRLAIVGRPNVGKSTLVNRLLGEARVITGPEPGVTRESIATDWEWQGRAVRLVDTAGLRRRARVSETLEFLSVQDARETIRFAELVVVVLDATEPAHRQDLTIASHVAEEGRALVLVLNKWDLVDEPKAALAALRRRVETSLAQVRGVTLVTLSALTGRGVERLMPAVFAAYDVWNTRVPTGPLNRWLAAAVERHPPPAAEGRRVRLRYITQVKARPPTFALFTTRPQAVATSYLRYLANGLRDAFGLDGVPLRIHTRRGRNPYVEGG